MPPRFHRTNDNAREGGRHEERLQASLEQSRCCADTVKFFEEEHKRARSLARARARTGLTRRVGRVYLGGKFRPTNIPGDPTPRSIGCIPMKPAATPGKSAIVCAAKLANAHARMRLRARDVARGVRA